MDNNQRGCLGEYLFATECIKRNYQVSFPLLDSSVYDCIVDIGDQLIKVQVKSTNKTPLPNRSSVHCVLHNSKSSYTIDKIDYFAVWVEYFNGFFIFKNQGEMQSIRLSLTGKNSKFFNNFAFN